MAFYNSSKLFPVLWDSWVNWVMNEEKLNISLRKFLKNVGITSQRKIEDKVKESIDSSKITSSKKIKISAQLVSIDLNLDEKIEGEIEVEI